MGPRGAPTNQSTIQVCHYNDVIMATIASQITSLTIVYSTVYSDADQRKHQSSASLAFVQGIHRGPMNSTHKWPVTRKTFPFDDVIMLFEERNINTTVFLISPCKFFYSLLRMVGNDFPTITLDMKWFSHYNIGYDKAPISHSVTFLSEKKRIMIVKIFEYIEL